MKNLMDDASTQLRDNSTDSGHEIETAAVFEPGILSVQGLEPFPIAHLVQHDSDSESGQSIGDSEENRSLPLLERRAEFISAAGIKANMSDSMGSGLICKNGEVLISSIAPGTLAENTPFQAGDRMLSVNAKRCYVMDPKQVAQVMASLVGNVTIVVHNSRGDPNHSKHDHEANPPN